MHMKMLTMLRLGQPLARYSISQRRFAVRKISSKGPEDSNSYEQVAKQQLRDYQKWRKHFTWRHEHVVQALRDYALWSILGLLAYHNMTKRHELQEYEADTFVALDKLEEKLHNIDPHNRLLKGTMWEQGANSSNSMTETEPSHNSEKHSTNHSKPIPGNQGSSRSNGGSSTPVFF